jgi:predicted RND superfamily exporter protein
MSASPEGIYSRLFLAWGRFIVRRRALLLTAIAVVTVALGVATFRLRVDSTLEAFLSTDAPVRLRLDQFRNTFGRDEVFVLAVEGDVYTADFLSRLRALHEAVGAVTLPEHADVIDEVRSLVNARRVTADAAEVRVQDLGALLPPAPDAAAIAAFRAAADTTSTAGLVAKDGHMAAIVVRTRRVHEHLSHQVYAELMDLARAHEAPGFHVQVGGAPALAAAIHERLLGDAYRSLAVALALMAVLLAVMFRHWLAVVAPLLVVTCAIVWTLGLMALLGYPMTALHNILPTFLLAVGLGDSVHLLSVFRTERGEGHAAPEALVRALGATGTPIIFTSITTAQGMLGFTFTRLGVTTEFGAFAAIGVMFALLLSLVLLPALLATRLGAALAPAEAVTSGRVERVVDRLVTFGARRPGVVLAGTVLICAVTAVGVSQIRVSHDPLRFLPADHPVRAAFEAIDTRLGGSVSLEVVVDARAPEALKDADLLRAWAALEEHMRAYPDPRGGGPLVHASTSILDVLRETWSALNADVPSHTALPPDRPAVAQTLLLFEMGGGKDLQRLVSAEQQIGRLSLRMPWRDAGSYGPLTEWLSEGVHASGLDARADVWPTGGVFTLFSVVNSLIEDFVTSFGTATAMIALMLVILLRNARLGLLALVPNLLPIFITLAVMGFADIPLDMFNLLIGSLAIGITDDDTIHFFHHVAAQRRAGATDVVEVLRHTGAYAGRAMVVTSLILLIGFGAFLTAGMVNLVVFGALTAVTLVVAVLGDLLLAPALLRVTWRWLGRPSK